MVSDTADKLLKLNTPVNLSTIKLDTSFILGLYLFFNISHSTLTCLFSPEVPVVIPSKILIPSCHNSAFNHNPLPPGV